MGASHPLMRSGASLTRDPGSALCTFPLGRVRKRDDGPWTVRD
jgi:hypothetical protein